MRVRHGRAEFNLLYDRGATFGLRTDGGSPRREPVLALLKATRFKISNRRFCSGYFVLDIA